jgi:hypothetical protein
VCSKAFSRLCPSPVRSRKGECFTTLGFFTHHTRCFSSPRPPSLVAVFNVSAGSRCLYHILQNKKP